MSPWITMSVVMAVIGAVWSQARVRNILLRKLLSAQKAGDKTAFTKLLATPAARLYFSKLTQIIMTTNFALSFEDIITLRKSIRLLVTQPQRNREFVICLMKAYTFYLERGLTDDALKIENSLQPLTTRFPEMKNEMQTLHQLFIEHDPLLVIELKHKLREEKTPEAQLVLLYRLSKLEELLGQTEASATHLGRLRRLARTNIKALN